MTEMFEFDLVFALPEGDHDAFELSDAVYEAGFEDSVIGTGQIGILGVSLEAEGENAEEAILKTARAIMRQLPKGSSLREVRPDLVSLADVAKKLDIKRQALQKRTMPTPAAVGFYRVTEIERALTDQLENKTSRTRRARFTLETARPWFAAGTGAQTLNAQMALGILNPESLVVHEDENAPLPPEASASA